MWNFDHHTREEKQQIIPEWWTTRIQTIVTGPRTNEFGDLSLFLLYETAMVRVLGCLQTISYPNNTHGKMKENI